MEKDKIKNDVNSQSLTVLDIITIFLKNKKNIFIITGIVFAVSTILYFFVFDLIYFSTATIKSSSKGSSILSALEGGFPDIGGLDELGVGTSKTTKELAGYEEILTSRRCIEELINKFNLMERNEYRFIEDAIKDFTDNNLILKQGKLSGVLYVGVLDKDPIIAKEMVEFLLNELNKINIEVSIQNAKNNREFIEKRYFQAKEDLTKSEDSLKAFQMIYGIAPDLQIKASAQSVFTLEAELKAEEVKLDVIKKILSSEEPEVKVQEAKVISLKSKIVEIEKSTNLEDFLRLGNSPHIAMSFLRLTRNVEIQNKILTFLIPLYEQAKIEEMRDTPSIIILDKPYIAERKTKPKRLTMVVVLTFLGFVFVNIFYILLERWKKFYINIKQKQN